MNEICSCMETIYFIVILQPRNLYDKKKAEVLLLALPLFRNINITLTSL